MLLRKHISRHERPYGCTFTNCSKKFGSKNDWKRHENTRHFQHESWYCQESITTASASNTNECGQVFHRRHLFAEHLRTSHGIVTNDRIREILRRSRIGRNGQVKFWCGFCQKTIPLGSQGLTAWDERFDHIDVQHFKKGQDIGDWVPPPNDGVLKNQHRTSTRNNARSDDSKEAPSQEQAAQDKRTNVLENPGSIFPSYVPFTRNLSFDIGRPPKRPRTVASRASSPTPSECHEGGTQVHPAISNPTETGVQAQTKSTPTRRTNRMIAESLYSVSDGITVPEPEPTYITCVSHPHFTFIPFSLARMLPSLHIPRLLFPLFKLLLRLPFRTMLMDMKQCLCTVESRFATSLCSHCLTCGHVPCVQCMKEW